MLFRDFEKLSVCQFWTLKPISDFQYRCEFCRTIITPTGLLLFLLMNEGIYIIIIFVNIYIQHTGFERNEYKMMIMMTTKNIRAPTYTEERLLSLNIDARDHSYVSSHMT